MSPDDVHRVHPFGRNAHRGHLGGENPAGKQFSAALDGIQAGRAQFSEKVNSLGDAPERGKQGVAALQRLLVLLHRQKFPDDGVVPGLELVQESGIGAVPGCGHVAYVNQCVRASENG